MASMFSDDAYNKDIDHEGPGTLIGNWWEEQGLRSAVGEGRCIPQRHLKRSGGLDFNKPANTGKREMDNTFERTQGRKSNHVAVPTSKQYGDGAHEAVNVPLPSQQKAPLEALLHKARMQQAADEVEEEDKLVEALNHERFFETTTGAVHTKPDETQAEKAVHVRTSAQSEVFCGPTANRSITLNNEGLNVPSHTHYSNVEGITHARMALADPKSAGDVSASMAGGMTLHGRHSGFTKPMQEFIDGTEKDEEMQKLHNYLKGTQPMRHISMAVPMGQSFQGIPSLAALKATVHNKIAETWGAFGYVALRQRLYDYGDSNNMIKKEDAAKVFREELAVSVLEVPEEALDVFLSQLCTMKKAELKIGSLMSSLRPILEQKDKRRVLEKFSSLRPVDGQVKLGTWLGQLDDADLKTVILSAFGASSVEMVADFPMQETVFLELFADLAPLTDISPLLSR